jgi:ABC-type nickel/cobalt efflux system permease component RcnA
MKRLLAVAAAALGLGAGLALLAPASPAAAHPLGNFSVNQLESITLYPDRVEVAAIVDTAELPTLQDKSTVDTSGDGAVSDDERAAHAARACAEVAGRFSVSVRGERLTWTVGATSYAYAPGAAGLDTGRLDCALTAPAGLAGPAEVRVDNHYLVDRVGWREITATGTGVRLIDPPVPAVSRSGGDLRAYPEDMLSNPPDVRTATLRTEPGEGGAAAAASTVDTDGSWTTRLVSAGEDKLNALVGEGGGILVGMLAVLLALTLGAAHAALPGHGKTIMAAYLAGKRGRARDAVAVGGVVTLTHTGGVLVVGLLLTTFASLVGQAVLGWLGVVSGVLVVGVGAAMLIALRRRGAAAMHGHHHGWLGHKHHHHGDGHGHPHDHDHTHDHTHDDEAHGHDHTHEDEAHGHDHAHEERRPSRLGIAGIGIAGGLVPSPSALIVLLGAVGLGRTLFGVLLVLAYGLGMAATLTAAGLALVGLQRRWATRAGLRARTARWHAVSARFGRIMPTATGSLVLLVGLGLVGRAAATLI